MTDLSNAPDPIAEAYNHIVTVLDGSPSNFLNTSVDGMRGSLNFDEETGCLFHKGVLMARKVEGVEEIILTEAYDPVAARMGAEKPKIIRISDAIRDEAVHLMRLKDNPRFA